MHLARSDIGETGSQSCGAVAGRSRAGAGRVRGGRRKGVGLRVDV